MSVTGSSHFSATAPTATQTEFAPLQRSVLGLGLGIYLSVHNWSLSTRDEWLVPPEEVERQSGLIGMAGQFGHLLVALVGLALFLTGPRRIRTWAGWLPWALLAWVLVVVASLGWTAEPAGAMKKVVNYLIYLSVGLLVAEQFSARQICWIVFWLSLSWSVIGVMSEALHGTLTPWQSGYRFAGTLHPNVQSANCARLCMAALALAVVPGSSRNFAMSCGWFGFVLLLLTKSRNGLIGCVVSLLAMGFTRLPREQRWWASFAAVWLVALAIFGYGGFGAMMNSQVDEIGSLGRNDGDVSNFSGRAELWVNLMDYVWERPLLGVGYSSFWNIDRMNEIARRQSWRPHHSHSTYIDTLITLGFVGVSTLVVTLLLGVRQAFRVCQERLNSGHLLFMGLLVFELFYGIAEVSLVRPGPESLFAAMTLGYLAWFQKHDDASDEVLA